jgi:hypothetical protein
MTHKHAPGTEADDDVEAGGPERARFESGRLSGETSVALPEDLLMDLASVMADGGGRLSDDVPAGHTYLGQFIAHDLSFEVVSPHLDVNRAGVVGQRRSPTLDLDSLYGDGPPPRPKRDSPYEEDGVHLSLGTTVDAQGRPERAGLDLPRKGADAEADARGEAKVPDDRNDENLAVAQTHVSFIRFHNAVVDSLGVSRDPFAQARALVRKHYQWIIWTDFLPKVCDPAVVDDVFANGRQVFEPDATSGDGSVPKLPKEFSIAAFRFGHSMLRPNYSWNERMDEGFASLDQLFMLSHNGGNLDGNLAIPSRAIADFRRLYDFDGDGYRDLAVEDREFNLAMRIDTALNVSLAALPPPAANVRKPVPPGERNLAFRDLMRARRRAVVTGQTLLELFNSRPSRLNIEPLRADLGKYLGGARLNRLSRAQLATLTEHTPLWLYVLREAEEHGNGKLTGVGARVVTEVVHRAMEASDDSILPLQSWHPTFGPDDETFRMTDLLIAAYGEAHLKNPLAS